MIDILCLAHPRCHFQPKALGVHRFPCTLPSEIIESQAFCVHVHYVQTCFKKICHSKISLDFTSKLWGVQLNRLNWSRLDFLSHRNFWTSGTLMRWQVGRCSSGSLRFQNCWTGIPMCLQLTPKMVLSLRYSNRCFIFERNQSIRQVDWEIKCNRINGFGRSMNSTTLSVISATFPVLSRTCFHSSMGSLTGLTRKLNCAC